MLASSERLARPLDIRRPVPPAASTSPRQRRFKAVFLDVGNTLLSMGDAPVAYQEILARYGYDIPLERLRSEAKAARQSSLSVPAGPLADHSIQAHREQARRARMVRDLLARLEVRDHHAEAVFDAIHESWLGTPVFNLYPDTPATLAGLKAAGYCLIAVSNWESRLEALCANHGIRQYFDYILASEAEGYAKPGPYLFRRALELAEAEPGEVVHVGDSIRDDIEPARALGIAAVLIARHDPPEVEYEPTIRSLSELLPLLENGLSSDPAW